ncbi:DNA polymerase III subunit alpha [Thermolongibacillus altinsuensis]|uniref:DNA polymerase III subunit alpha n=1 Tax=Thermolongibacillus altinsuensis TaxID=575256 RepID=UPI0010454D42|nr:DNA polymerase III subunit alpha [Thermolongibacillus altinsuensis]
MAFVHLQVRSGYSLLTSTVKVDELVKRAKELGFPALALTDENVLYGAIAFYKECKKHQLKPIIGMIADLFDEEGENDQLILLAKNNEGYKNLLKISSLIQTNEKSAISHEQLAHYTNGLIAVTSGWKGRIETLVLGGYFEEAKKLVHLYTELFQRENFYLGVQNHGLPQELQLFELLPSFSVECGIPLVATNNVYYLDREDAFAHDCLLAMKHGKKVNDPDRPRLANDEYYLKSIQEMERLFERIPSALENTIKIAEQCDVELNLGTMMLPRYPVPNGKTADDYLAEWCWEGLKKRLSQPSERYIKRMEHELQIIKRMKFSDYFLIVADFMKFAREQGILTGPGRGSAAGSLVAYALEITQIDPLEYDLLFERFLNPARISFPDIDIDFPDHRREEVIRYIQNKYGEQHVAQIITFGTFGARSALRDVGRVLDVSLEEIQGLLKKIPESDGSLKSFAHALPKNKFIETAMKLEGLPRHTSIHAAGIVISAQPLVEAVPVQSGQVTMYVTQYAMDDLEEIGLLKIDLLGLKNLTILEQALKSIEMRTGERLNINDIPHDDAKTYELLSKGDTLGVFQLESEGMKRILRQLQPSTFEDLVAVNALYRPGPMEQIPLYIKRKHGQEKVTYFHDDLKEILQSTYGVLIYQEQIMKIAEKMAGFSLGEADLLRRAISKKDVHLLVHEKKHFIEGCIRKGYSHVIAEQLYKLIVRFAHYGFNRSHAVAYSRISYVLAYLKAHYPCDFYAALLTNSVGNKERMTELIHEIRRKGIALLRPSIHQSGYRFLVEQGAIRYSLLAIKHVSYSFIKEVIEERKKRPFHDFFDFMIRLAVQPSQKKMIEALIFAGCFDEFGVDRATLQQSIDVAIEHAELLATVDSLTLKPKYVEAPPLSVNEKLKYEKELLGTYVSPHPVAAFSHLFALLGAKPIYEWVSAKETYGKMVVYIEEVNRTRTRKGEEMAFLKIHDDSEEMKAVVFPNCYDRFHHVLEKGKVVYLEGKLEWRPNGIHLIVQRAMKPAILYLKIDEHHVSSNVLHQLKNILKKHHGHTPVILYYEKERRKIQLPNEYAVHADEQCLEQLKALLGEGNVALK